MRVQGWDPVLLLCQIISLQALHYLTLSLLLPPLLASLTSPTTLLYSGGSTTVPHILDWREMAARPTVSSSSFPLQLNFGQIGGAWAGGKQIGVIEGKEGRPRKGGAVVLSEDEDGVDWGVDIKRGWVIAGGWLVACAIDILPLYYLIRRPTHILDFSLTLNFIHLILTTYYSKSFPTSLFFWLIQGLGAALMIVVAEQLCVKRELHSDISTWAPNAESGEVIELNDR